MSRVFFAAVMLVMCSGCMLFLPDGKAPEGKITDNSPQEKLSSAELENHAATSLCAFILTSEGIHDICSADEPSERVLKNVSAVTGVRILKYSALRLAKAKERFTLSAGKNQIIWQYPEQ